MSNRELDMYLALISHQDETHLALPVLESSTTLNGRFLCGRLSIWNGIKIMIYGQSFTIKQ